jgi:thiol-disulfide isomerase/thioredoxin
VNCGPCIKEIPRLNALAEKYQGKLTLLSINSDLRHAVEKEYLQKFVARHKIKYPVLLDTDESKLMEKFNVNGWPIRYLLSIEGYFYMEPVEKRRQLSLDEIQNFLEKL